MRKPAPPAPITRIKPVLTVAQAKQLIASAKDHLYVARVVNGKVTGEMRVLRMAKLVLERSVAAALAAKKKAVTGLLFVAACGLLTGCNPFREDTALMYRDGWGGTTVAVPGPNQPMPYGASMPALRESNLYPEALMTGWYVDCRQQWRPQRWVKLGTDINGNPTYKAIYP